MERRGQDCKRYMINNDGRREQVWRCLKQTNVSVGEEGYNGRIIISAKNPAKINSSNSFTLNSVLQIDY